MIRTGRRKPRPVELLDAEIWRVPQRLNETDWRRHAGQGGRRHAEILDREEDR
jgi:hypothetical protein